MFASKSLALRFNAASVQAHRITVFLFLAFACFPVSTVAQQPSVGATPPMGWNSWNKFGCNVSDKLIREIADAIVTSGMKQAGYQYVNIDDCWQVSRAADGS